MPFALTVVQTYVTGLIILFILLPIPAAVVAAMKGRWFLFVAGFIFSGVWIVTSLRLAEPDSWWARRFYDEEKLLRSKRRYLTELALELDALPPPEPSVQAEGS